MYIWHLLTYALIAALPDLAAVTTYIGLEQKCPKLSCPIRGSGLYTKSSKSIKQEMTK